MVTTNALLATDVKHIGNHFPVAANEDCGTIIDGISFNKVGHAFRRRPVLRPRYTGRVRAILIFVVMVLLIIGTDAVNYFVIYCREGLNK